MSVYFEIEKIGIIAILRHIQPHMMMPVAEVLQEAGITILEVTMETPGALKMIETLRTEFPDHLTVGAGTVLDAETARAAMLSGAQFVVSPTVNIEMIRTVKRYGGLCMPGAMTPTEIVMAYENGADMVKIFPAHVLGPTYFRAVSSPLPHIPFVATGGINLENAGSYISAGAVAVGLGHSLFDPRKEMTDEGFIQLKKTASKFVEKVRNAKRSSTNRAAK
ncbi:MULTISPECIES: bifunctional 4-hydroxy-2-oxoglutarate aldolase/2-dehydro-3-deoxy-phosphogluconate aldolase [Geobacillus]|jgi:2-dehydro-3-deoxyphosphogluconate aldolase / (4S)-4-hydroxy-2-oxoglutarate aldolase|uniref:bifunctional 4-hydroxy-2-oxoglutarate aldolase/2-dehydro-3-deoxy-phosphogluconate aldolase n=1 Tax=Geobacillus TaxID=129337 RepID=UPI0006E5E413|nr:MULTISPECIES: bifunctional 4-hydroxy-2-oxoglutarate aldolase/2-dehydro-3-deoxy-phosphogluconate aldolase [Geobacillus]KQB93423.1 2-dehydro-3-deoxyphosphogluconate aldolase [Geobacillus sp. PA-3]MEC5186523.1 2-dehydro-3-deoxyphosphogluconate aldolase/(4S)-4-hydroxy-2-oxoglutarate aldolase [Geobacillus thermodenitrificans]OQP14004.1 2-dehydro-3-deoxyphosphogluconate aldolase [Geobacillus zalihae]